ncbi:uncharacterized protein LOC101896941 [Musca domestica]|uniref:Uncharacterized protein LOC101896941 n=1 Tax=Musca domestica TaxID=7370 RepID=A0A9J7IDX8_MUSDO|nr:uncharacterized protein LOC101896941 [Musca domestica]
MSKQRKYFIIFLFLLLHHSSVDGARFEFILDNDRIFDDCTHIPGSKGMDHLLDFKELHMEFQDGRVGIRGNSTNVWEGVKSTDIVQGHGELHKFQRGDWQPTPILMVAMDFCKVQFDPKTDWYQLWTKNVPEHERKCINTYGQVYHYNDFTVDTVFDFPANMEGRYKLVTRFRAMDPVTLQYRPSEICYQVLGEFIKLK